MTRPPDRRRRPGDATMIMPIVRGRRWSDTRIAVTLVAAGLPVVLATAIAAARPWDPRPGADRTPFTGAAIPVTALATPPAASTPRTTHAAPTPRPRTVTAPTPQRAPTATPTSNPAPATSSTAAAPPTTPTVSPTSPTPPPSVTTVPDPIVPLPPPAP